MAATTRVYVVTDTTGNRRLVRATHPNHALRHVAESAFTVAVATVDEALALSAKGVKVEQVKHEQQELPT